MRPLLVTAPLIRRLFSTLGVDVVRFRSNGVVGMEALYKVYTNSRSYWDWQALQEIVAKEMHHQWNAKATVEIVRHEVIAGQQCLVFWIALSDLDRPSQDDIAWIAGAEPISSDN